MIISDFLIKSPRHKESKMFVVACDFCERKSHRRACDLTSYNKHFCNRSCCARYFGQKRATGRHKNKNGYIRLVWRDEEGKIIRKFEHRKVMEDFLGRNLESNEVIHHKNGIRDDNHLSNLEVRLIGNHPVGHEDRLSEEINKLIQRVYKLEQVLLSNGLPLPYD